MRALLMLACTGAPEELPSEHLAEAPPEAGEGGHQLIPPHDPFRENHKGGFEPNAQWYGEPGWNEVRMRVAGHLSVIYRDRARLEAAGGDPEAAAALYDEVHAHLSALPEADGVAGDIRTLLVDAAKRDAARMRGEPYTLQPVEDIDLSSFEDFDDRHRLRVELWSAYLQSVDPAAFNDPWGYWPMDVDAPAEFRWEDMGRLPTGDTLIDTAGEPGPVAIGKLQKLDASDLEHQAWLKAAADRLNGTEDVVGMVRELVRELDRHPYGSRYYNIKALRNEGVRVLARRGRYDQALALLQDSRPLKAHDWACPNREGILLAVEGRLLALSGSGEAEARLKEAAEVSLAFLDDVNRAEQTPSAPHTPGKAPPTRPPEHPPPPPRR